MASELIDDTKSSTSGGVYGPALIKDIAEISRYTLNRNRVYGWARDLRFLVYDDEVDEKDEAKSGDHADEDLIDGDGEDGMLQRALAMSRLPDDENINSEVEVGIDAAVPTSQSSTTTSREDVSSNEKDFPDRIIPVAPEQNDHIRGSEAGSDPNPDDNGDQGTTSRHPLSCSTCLRYPLFPASGRPAKFKVIQFDPQDLEHRQLCNHYLAVSYCWQSDGSGNAAQAERSYRVRVQEKDGRFVERRNRAPNHIIDRAVDAARAHGADGMRLIWIDQECLPQDDSEEHELGIQAMDMVYQRARLTVGLFESVMESQAHLDVVASVLDWGTTADPSKRRLRQRKPGLPIATYCQYLLDFLEFFADDKWNQRAWILQEAFSSANDLSIMIKTAPAVQFHHPPSSVFTSDPNWVPGSFSIVISDVLKLLKVSREFFVAKMQAPDMCGPMRLGIPVSADLDGTPWFERVSSVLYKVDELYPVAASTTNRHAFMYAIGGANYGPRKTCNAAVALYFLRSRLNHRPADRIAIVANLCDYEIRLDTVEVERRFKSLTACLVALSLINGDLSLLAPDVYNRTAIKAPSDGPSWALPFQKILPSLDMKALRAGWNLCLRNSKRYTASDAALTLPGYAWDVNRKVDFALFKQRWESTWKMWTCYQIEFDHRENETQAEHQARTDEASRQVKQAHGLDRGFHDTPTTIGEVFRPDPALGATVIRILSADRIEHYETGRTVLGRIFIDLLQYLCYYGELSLANSVWHSIRMDCIKAKDDSGYNWEHSNLEGLPDDVLDLLSDQKLLNSNPWLLLQLDRNHRGSYNQVWLLERIMTYGCLWVGDYMEPTTSAQQLAPEGETSLHEDAHTPEPSHKLHKRASILETQTRNQIMAFEWKKDLYKKMSPDEEESAVSDMLALGQFISLVNLLGTEESLPERRHRLRQQVATFDVDGPCLIVTPFDNDMERLPRSAVRSMAMAWAVEPISDGRDTENHIAGDDADHAARRHDVKAEGARESSYIGSADRAKRRDKGKGRAKLEDHGTASKASQELRFQRVLRESDLLAVRRRVMGLWEIMEEPLHSYSFV